MNTCDPSLPHGSTMWTQQKALEYILSQLEQHPMNCTSATAAVMRGDYSEVESADDADTALTSELAAICRLALGLPSPNNAIAAEQTDSDEMARAARKMANEMTLRPATSERLIAACKDDAERAEWWAAVWAMYAGNRPLWRSRVRRMKARAARAAERVAVTRGKSLNTALSDGTNAEKP